jgi:hypothetical protein
MNHGFDVSMDGISRASDNEVLIIGKYSNASLEGPTMAVAGMFLH